jgi:hypothetical protein
MPNWSDVLIEIGHLQQQQQAQAQQAANLIRLKYLQALASHTERNVIAYYSGFLSKPELPADINDEDKNGFMMAVHKLDRRDGLDLILHTPGGDVASTQSIVHYLHQMFGENIRAIVPQVAMSSGTMLACSCKEILMGKHSNLGPIDPHLRGVPAYGVKREFLQAFREMKRDPAKVYVWQPILSQYRPTFLSQCENAIKWSNTFVQEQLQTVMFASDKNAKQKAKSVVRRLASYSANKSHTRHIHFDECRKIGLKVTAIEDDKKLQDLVLTVHHCYMHLLMNTPAFKIIENQRGTAFIKQHLVVNGPGGLPAPPSASAPLLLQ